MKKSIFLFASAIALMFTFNSCGSDSDKDVELKFSTLSVEQQKLKIEESANTLMNKMSVMEETKAFVAISQLGDLENPFAVSIQKLKSDLSKNDVKALIRFGNQLKAASIAKTGYWGEKNWNHNTKQYDFVKQLSNKAIIHFPGSAYASSNNATLTVSLVNSSIMTDINGLDYLPSSFSVILTVDGKEVLNSQFTAQYSVDGLPTKVNQTLVIDKFNWTVDFTNSGKNISTSFQFKYDTEVLLKYELGAAGNFSYSEMLNSEVPAELITSASMNFQIMNVGAKGKLDDFKGFMLESYKIDDNATKESADKQALLLNKYLKMYGYFVKEQQKFADVEFYVVEKSFMEYNYVTHQIEQNYSYEPQPRLVLSDGSKQDFQTFIQTGFSADFVSEFETIISLLK